MEARDRLVPQLRFKEFEKGLEILKLEELVSFKSGGTPSKDNPKYWGGDIPWISAASMNGKYYSTSERTITKEGLKNGSKLAPKGSLLLLVRGSMLFNKIPIGIAEVDVAFNQDLKALATKENTNTDFVYQWFFSKQNLLLDKVVGTGIGAGKLDTDELKSMNVHLPTLPEQEKIASFLSAVDKKIQQLTRKKELLEQYKKGVMQQLFSGKLRFKDEQGKEFPEWEEKSLEDCCDLKNGYTFKSSSYSNDGEYNVVTIKNVQDGYMANDFSKISALPSNLESHQKLAFGDILISMTGNVGRVCRVSFENCLLNQRVGKLEVKNINPDYFYHVINNEEFQAEMINAGQGAAQMNIGKKDILGFRRFIPSSFEEQKKIADYLGNIDSKIERVGKQIEQTQNFKKGLLQQMFV